MRLSDPRVARYLQTCGACPEQYEGTLVDGREFYFRYRHGWAGLAVGEKDRGPHRFRGTSPIGAEDVGMAHGDEYQGQFESGEDRNRVFTTLLDRIVLPGDDISVDEVMEASFEHAQDEYEARREA